MAKRKRRGPQTGRQVVICSWVSPPEYTRLRGLAALRGTTVSAMLREAMRRELDNLGRRLET